MANALTDEPLSVQKGFDKYNLDRTEDSINEFNYYVGGICFDMGIVRTTERKYEKEMDESMKDFL
ncbi:MAG: hypothetical protein HDQ99_04890 [Lachnospiraceae bacterium]|nr:hypothetical protein [Lachnospiraceae bacterium]